MCITCGYGHDETKIEGKTHTHSSRHIHGRKHAAYEHARAADGMTGNSGPGKI